MARKCYENGQKQTDSAAPWEVYELSPKQIQAVGMLLDGQGVSEVAAEIGVARQTVSKWLNEDPYFMAAMNRGRLELWNGTQDRVRKITSKALEVVSDTLNDTEDPRRLDAAMGVLKLFPAGGKGATSLSFEPGPLDPVEIMESMVLGKAEKETDNTMKALINGCQDREKHFLSILETCKTHAAE